MFENQTQTKNCYHYSEFRLFVHMLRVQIVLSLVNKLQRQYSGRISLVYFFLSLCFFLSFLNKKTNMFFSVLFPFFLYLTLKIRRVRGRSPNWKYEEQFPLGVQIRSWNFKSDDGDVEDVGYNIKKTNIYIVNQNVVSEWIC